MSGNYEVERERLADGWNVTCYHCEEEFEAKRFDATFCSSRCRTAHHRKLKQLDKDIETMHQTIDMLIDRCPRRGYGKIAENLNLARNRIDYLLSRLEDYAEDTYGNFITPDKFQAD